MNCSMVSRIKRTIKILGIVLIYLSIFVFFYMMYLDYFKPSKYKYIRDTINYRVIGVVKRIAILHDGRDADGVFVYLSNDSVHAFRLIDFDVNAPKKRIKKPWIYEFIKQGDSIYKEKNSNELNVYRNGKLVETFFLTE